MKLDVEYNDKWYVVDGDYYRAVRMSEGTNGWFAPEPSHVEINSVMCDGDYVYDVLKDRRFINAVHEVFEREAGE